MRARRRYLPAASLDLLLPLYDPIMRVLGFTRALTPLVAQAELHAGQRVLEIGCGTGSLLMAIALAAPGVRLTGIDPDPRALERAADKARRGGVDVALERAFADALPFAGESFDRVFSSMMFHHVPRGEKAGVLADVRRVLKPGGRLEFLDFPGGQRTLLKDADGPLIGMMRDAGLADARRTGTHRTRVGAIASYQASR